MEASIDVRLTPDSRRRRVENLENDALPGLEDPPVNTGIVENGSGRRLELLASTDEKDEVLASPVALERFVGRRELELLVHLGLEAYPQTRHGEAPRLAREKQEPLFHG
jgi:hypothetical protein